jgi:hypothetical protein
MSDAILELPSYAATTRIVTSERLVLVGVGSGSADRMALVGLG